MLVPPLLKKKQKNTNGKLEEDEILVISRI